MMLLRLFIFACLFTVSVAVTACLAPLEQWQEVMLANSKVGYRHSQRNVQDGKCYTRELLVLQTQVPGQAPVESQIVQEYWETLDGKPLAMRKSVHSDSANHVYLAQVKGSRLNISQRGPQGLSREQSLRIPPHFLLAEGVRQALLNRVGGRLSYSAWSFSKMQFHRYELDVRRTPEDAPAAPGVVWEITRRRADPQQALETKYRADHRFIFLREESQSNGEPFVLETCSQTCATSGIEPLQNVYRRLIRSPYRIPETALHRKIRYQIAGVETLPETSEQHVVRDAGALQVTVCSQCGSEPPPGAAELREALLATYWLDYQDPGIQTALEQALGGRDLSASQRMQRLQWYVTQIMRAGTVNYAGYATASEALTNKNGDCTEQALLLAALGRAAGVPTRIASGLVYSNERFYGKLYRFVPHAWAQAWVGDRWQSYDSGMEGFTAGHIVLGLSNGEQAAFIQMTDQLRSLKIVDAAQMKRSQHASH